MSINLTERAAEKVSQYLNHRGKGEGLRLGVKTTGCSGLAYVLEYVDQPDADDVTFESRGVKLFVDPKSLVYINGTQVDFKKDGLNEGFSFENPNTAGECGCGESFTV